MEVCSPCGKSVSGKENKFPALSAGDQKGIAQGNKFDCLVSNLENAVAECLHIEDTQGGESATIDDDVKEVKEEAETKEIMQELPQEDCHSESLPSPLVLVPAIKGSREKLGLSPRKLTVTWAPDVYDPIPTSLSHTVTRGKNKQRLFHKKNNGKKKNGKNKQKGNTSRGSGGGKDKKQSRKVVNAANDRLLDAPGCYEDFDIGSSDYCGSTFLIQSLTKVHYSTAEAL